MLQRDYILEIIEQFVNAVLLSLRKALVKQDREAAEEVEEAVATLLDLDPSVALELSPDSLVTMMLLSGMADSVAEYVAYTLHRLGDAYEGAGEESLAAIRRAQAEAVAESFMCDLTVPPQGLEELDI